MAGNDATSGEKNTVRSAIDLGTPPYILVGVNLANTDVPERATWLSKTDNQFTYVVTDQDAEVNEDSAKGTVKHDLRKGGFLKEVLDWVWKRLNVGATPMHTPDPVWGSIGEAWHCQTAEIIRWSKDAWGLDEQWAQWFSELFAGVNYSGTGFAYSMDGLGGDGAAWDPYIYSRLQSSYLEQVVVVGLDGTKHGKGVQSWDNLSAKEVNQKTAQDREWLKNDDPASPLMGACQYSATFALITRGFRIEPEAGKDSVSVSRELQALSAAPAGSSPAVDWVWFTSRGGMMRVKDTNPASPTTDTAIGLIHGVVDAAAHDLSQVVNPAIDRVLTKPEQLRPGTVITYHPYHHFANSQVTFMLDPASKPQPRQLNAAAVDVAQLSQGELSNEETAKKTAIANRGLLPGSVAFIGQVTGQPGGSHIQNVLRVHPSGQQVQLFDAGGSVKSEGVLQTASMEVFKDLRLLKYNPMGPCNMETCGYENLGENASNQANSNGVGFAHRAPDLEASVRAMSKARPIGLARFVLTKRKKNSNDIAGADVLFVSRLLRTYGDESHQNFTIARFMWSLRNMPGFSSVQGFWAIFIPQGKLARAMWAQGARTKTLQDYVNKYGNVSYASDYTWSQIVSNTDDPVGYSTLIWSIVSSPPATPGGKTVLTEKGALPAFFKAPIPGIQDPKAGTTVMPDLTPTKDGKGYVGNPYLALRWDQTFVRSDIEALSELPGCFKDG